MSIEIQIRYQFLIHTTKKTNLNEIPLLCCALPFVGTLISLLHHVYIIRFGLVVSTCHYIWCENEQSTQWMEEYSYSLMQPVSIGGGSTLQHLRATRWDDDYLRNSIQSNPIQPIMMNSVQLFISLSLSLSLYYVGLQNPSSYVIL